MCQAPSVPAPERDKGRNLSEAIPNISQNIVRLRNNLITYLTARTLYGVLYPLLEGAPPKKFFCVDGIRKASFWSYLRNA